MKNYQADKPPELSLTRLLVPFFLWIIIIFALSAYPKAIIPQGKYISWDKLAHVVEFSILGYLTARYTFFSGVAWIHSRWIPLTILFGAIYAASDEWHQLHVPGRLGTTYDVIADIIGVTLGFWIFWRGIPAYKAQQYNNKVE